MEQTTTTSLSFSKIMLPLCVMVFCSYMTIGLSLGVLPGFLHNTLHCNDLVVGLLIGIQSLATLLTRHQAGHITDTKGVKVSVAYGTVTIIAASLFYMVAVLLSSSLITSVIAIIIARMLSGAAESLQITGALAWGIGRAGQQRSGKVMAWNGIAMYGGLAAGAPIGIFLLHQYGVLVAFAGIIALSVAGWVVVAKLEAPLLHKTEKPRSSFGKVVAQIAKYGLGLSFSAIAFGCIASFITLFFQEKGWTNASLAFILFGTSYICVRIFFASLTDRYGGNKIAFFSLLVELTGQLLLWHAQSPEAALAGACLTGIGFSLIFPAFGVEAVRSIAPQMRGTALGAYVAFFDVALAVTSPLAGIIANACGYQNVFAYGSAGALIAIVIAFVSMVSQSKARLQ
jgi:MFS family permease